MAPRRSALYVPCPRCKGERQVYAYTALPDDGRPARGEYFQCPLCLGTGEADRDRAEQWQAAQVEGDDE